MANGVLYISYTGLLDPLGQSQVLQYVLKLAAARDMVLMSFEKPRALRDGTATAQVAAQCAEAGVTWVPLVYHRRPPGLAKVWDIWRGSREARRLIRDRKLTIVHCRSYIAGLMGLSAKRTTGARFVFDMRGFWPDERVDGGIWRRGGLAYRLAKLAERRLLRGADHIVTLTRAGASELVRFPYLRGGHAPVSVIPTCTNLDLFRPMPRPKAAPGFTLGYVGSAGSWYMFPEVARAVRLLFDRDPQARFAVVNKGGHDAIRAALAKADVDLSRVTLVEAPFDRVADRIADMDAGIFFIKPLWSKRASCPTRMGEFLACGKPCLANAGVGDVAADLHETGTGVTVEGFDDATLNAALDRLIRLTQEPKIAATCRKAAEARFALAAGVEEYGRIYDRLAGKDDGP